MVKFLEPEVSPKKDLYESLTTSISDMIGTYEKRKQSENLASLLDIPKDKRAEFASLPPEWQKFYAQNVQRERASEGKQAAAISKDLEKLPRETARYLKDFHPALDRSPEAKRKIEELSKKHRESGLGNTESIKAAIEEYKSPKQMPGKEKVPEAAGDVPQERKKSFMERILEPAEGGKEGILSSLFRPSELSAGQMVGAPALGALAPLEELGQYLEPSRLALAASQKFGLFPDKPKAPLVSEKLREKLYEGLSPEGIKQAQALEFVGGILPVESLLGGLVKIGKEAGFLKNAEKLAVKEGISTAEAVKNIAKEAESAGIDLAKAAQGDKQEAGKLYNLSNRVSKEVPKTGTEMRIERAEPKKKMFPKEERIAIREEQLKSFPKYEAEIAKDAAERAARAEAKIPKTVKGRQSKELRIHAARKNLPIAEEGYRKAIGRVRALEDEVAALKKPDERLKGLLEASKSELRDAEFFLKQTMQNIAGGESRAGLAEMRKAAQTKMLSIADDISAGKKIELAKMDYNPKMIQEAKNISKKKPLPAVKQDDFYQKVHLEYGDQYRNQLARIEKEIKDLPKNMASAEQIRNLQKEKDILKKLIDQTEAERTIHRHKLGLRETAERHKAKERLKGLREAEGHPKVKEIAKEKIEKAARNPSSIEAEEVAKSAGVKPEDIKEGLNKMGDFWKKASEKIVKEKGKISSRTIRELEKMWDVYKKEGALKALQTPAGKQIIFTIGQIALEEYTGRTMPYASSLASAFSGGKAAGVRGLIIFGYRQLRDKYLENKYSQAIKSQDDKTVLEISKKHPRIAKKVKEQME